MIDFQSTATAEHGDRMLSKSSYSGKPKNSSSYCKSTQPCEPEAGYSELKQNNPSALNHSNAFKETALWKPTLSGEKDKASLCAMAAFPSTVALPSKARRNGLILHPDPAKHDELGQARLCGPGWTAGTGHLSCPVPI